MDMMMLARTASVAQLTAAVARHAQTEDGRIDHDDVTFWWDADGWYCDSRSEGEAGPFTHAETARMLARLARRAIR